MPKLLDQVRLVLRTRHYSIRTEQAYVSWIRDFIFRHLQTRAESSLALFGAPRRAPVRLRLSGKSQGAEDPPGDFTIRNCLRLTGR